ESYAEIYFRKKEFQLALEKLDESLRRFDIDDHFMTHQICSKILNDNILSMIKLKAEIYFTLFEIKREDSFLMNAQSHSRLLIQLADRYRQQLESQGSQLFISKELKPAYEQAIKIALKLHEITGEQKYLEEALGIAEKSKAVLLMHALNNVRAKYSAGLPDSLLSKERELKANISFYQKQVFKEQNKIEGRNDAKIDQWERKIFELEREEDQFQDFLKESYPEYFEYKYQQDSLYIRKLQKELPSNTLMYEYFAGDSALYIFSLDRSNLAVRIIEDVDSLYRNVQKLRNSLDDSEESLDKSEFVDLSHQLFQELLTPEIEDFDNVLIIPDDELGRLPFDLLLCEAPKDQRYRDMPYLFKEKTLQYAYSADLLFNDPLKRQVQQASKLWLGVAPEFENERKLLFNKEEVAQIELMLEGEAFSGYSATQKSFLDNISSYRILHLATHASANMDNPQFSKIEFSYEDSLRDGILYTHELMNQRLNAELVVLSACETGKGNVAKGEGIMSLAWAFRYAGSPSILMSLWKAESSVSKRIMLSFYKYLKEGKSKTEALQEAKLDYIANPIPGREHPKYWSNFVLIGNDAPLFSKPWWKIGGIIILILLTLSIGYSRFRKSATHLAA
ncbi:MAG: CHAT domain-containing protein, partial [Bacteroidota bacterium]